MRVVKPLKRHGAIPRGYGFLFRRLPRASSSAVVRAACNRRHIKSFRAVRQVSTRRASSGSTRRTAQRGPSGRCPRGMDSRVASAVTVLGPRPPLSPSGPIGSKAQVQ